MAGDRRDAVRITRINFHQLLAGIVRREMDQSAFTPAVFNCPSSATSSFHFFLFFFVENGAFKSA
jgi:hypothetical protein